MTTKWLFSTLALLALPGLASERRMSDKDFDAWLPKIFSFNYSGLDTAAFLAEAEQRTLYNQSRDELYEAQAIIQIDRGEYLTGVVLLKKLNRHSPRSARLLAEGLMAREEKYEAAPWFRKAAQTAGSEDPMKIQCLEKYLSIKPDDKPATLELGRALEKQHRDIEAAEIYVRHFDLITSSADEALHAAGLLIRIGWTKQALRFLEKAGQLSPNDAQIAIRLAEAAESAQTAKSVHHPSETADAWWKAWKLDPANQALGNKVLASLVLAKDTAKLISTANQLLLQNPGDHGLHFTLAQLYLESADKKSSYAHLEKALVLQPENKDYMALLMHVIEGDSLIAFHMETLETVYKTNRGASLQHLLLLAKAYSLRGRRSEAANLWTTIYRLSPARLAGRKDAILDLREDANPDHAPILQDLGEKYLAQVQAPDSMMLKTMLRIRLQNGDLLPSAQLARRLLAAYPSEMDLPITVATALVKYGMEGEAKGMLTQILSKSISAEASFLLGRIHLQQGQFPEAADHFHDGRDFNPEAIRYLAEAYAGMKEYAIAARELSSYQAVTGDSLVSNKILQWQEDAFFETQNHLEAVQYIESLDRKKEIRGEVWAKYGHSLLELKRYHEAGEALQRALDMGVKDNRLLIDRARAYRTENSKDMAESILNYLLEKNPDDYLALFWFGKFAEEDGKPLIAHSYYSKALKLAPHLQAHLQVSVEDLATLGINESAGN